MAEHPIEALMQTTMESLKEIVDVNTIVGEPVETIDGTVVIPISRISLGFASGGGEYEMKGGEREQGNSKMPFAGGTGAGVSVQPVAFMVVGKEHIKLLPANSSGMVERIIDLAPQVIEELQASFRKRKNNDGTKERVKEEVH